MSCGGNFSVIVDSKGYMYSCGSSEAGQLGHGYPKEIIEGTAAVEFECEVSNTNSVVWKRSDDRANWD